MNWAAQQRQNFIPAHLGRTGTLNRADLIEAFQISAAQAALDIRAYRAANPDALVYDLTAKCYRAAQGCAVPPHVPACDTCGDFGRVAPGGGWVSPAAAHQSGASLPCPQGFRP